MSVAEAGQHRTEIDAGKLHRIALQFDDVTGHGSLQCQRHSVDAEQRFETRVLIVPLGRNLDDDVVMGPAVTSDECKNGVAAADLTVDDINHAATCSVNRMELDRIKSVAHASPPRS